VPMVVFWELLPLPLVMAQSPWCWSRKRDFSFRLASSQRATATHEVRYAKDDKGQCLHCGTNLGYSLNSKPDSAESELARTRRRLQFYAGSIARHKPHIRRNASHRTLWKKGAERALGAPNGKSVSDGPIVAVTP
jgi:hypothetical protein